MMINTFHNIQYKGFVLFISVETETKVRVIIRMLQNRPPTLENAGIKTHPLINVNNAAESDRILFLAVLSRSNETNELLIARMVGITSGYPGCFSEINEGCCSVINDCLLILLIGQTCGVIGVVCSNKWNESVM